MPKITALLFIMPVKDLDAAASFYVEAFDLREVFRNERICFVGIPGSDSHTAFAILVAILLALLPIEIWLLRRLDWL